jgi:hypothetical protein
MTDLWAIHVEGPDSVLAMPSREVAEEKAKQINDTYEAFIARPGARPDVDVRWCAAVVPWPYTAEGHAEALPEALEGVESGEIW